jgi:hypothetical protein
LLVTAETSGQFDEWRVANGRVERMGRCFVDSGRRLEKALLRKGLAGISNPTLERIARAIG